MEAIQFKTYFPFPWGTTTVCLPAGGSCGLGITNFSCLQENQATIDP